MGGSEKMGTLPERIKTTEYARKKIKNFLKSGEDDYTSALLLSSIYAELRLRTLLTAWMSPPQQKREKTSSMILNKLSFNQLIVLCNKLGLLQSEERKNLDALREKRNKVAHETRLWKKIPESEKNKIEHLSNFTIQFLERTNS